MDVAVFGRSSISSSDLIEESHSAKYNPFASNLLAFLVYTKVNIRKNKQIVVAKYKMAAAAILIQGVN